MMEPIRILIIDDEPNMREMLTYELSLSGYGVESAPDATRGIELLQRERFDLLLLDIKMPQIDGVEALTVIKQISQDTSVIMMTGHATIETAVGSLTAGACDYIQKPFELDQLHFAISRELERRRLSATVALYQAGLTIFAAPDEGSMIERIVQLTATALAADQATLLYQGPHGQWVPLHLHDALSTIEDGSSSSESSLDALDQLLIQRIAAHGEPVILPDGQHDDSPIAEPDEWTQVGSSIIYPLLKDGRLLGVLTVRRTTQPLRFGALDLQRATILASMIVLALDNALLMKDLQQRIDELAETQQRLIHSDKMAALGQLAAGVAHEINNPSAFIALNLNQLQEHVQHLATLVLPDGLDAVPWIGEPSTTQVVSNQEKAALAGSRSDTALRERKTILQEMDQMLRETSLGFVRIVDIVHDLRSFARIGQRNRQPFVLSSSIETALRLVRMELRQKGQWAVQLAPHVRVVGNQGQLSQVFINLLLNAAQALPEGYHRESRVDVTLRTASQWAEVTIRDTGCGIPPEHMAQLFTPFFTSKQEQGTGLGLTISREIIQQHDGDISIQSSPGQGTEVLVKLPLAQEEETLNSPDPRLAPLQTLPRLKILLVDDEEGILHAYRRLLGPRHNVLVAASGAEALGIMRQQPDIDIILCDLLMTELSGMDVYEQAGQYDATLLQRFLFMSGDAFTLQAKQFAQQHAQWILLKPFEMEQLELLIRKRLATR